MKKLKDFLFISFLQNERLPDIENLETDLADGTRLVALVEALQKRKLRHNKRPLNQHHELENIAIALDAIKEDGIKLVNIGRKFDLFIVVKLEKFIIVEIQFNRD